jgi:hypothetical protein
VSIDLDHLGDMFAAEPVYDEAWAVYESQQRPPEDEDPYYRWKDAGRKPTTTQLA